LAKKSAPSLLFVALAMGRWFESSRLTKFPGVHSGTERTDR
jgi:hypothetical protein